MENQLEQKIQELEKRVERLEAKERTRQILGIIKVIITIALWITVVVFGVYLYKEFNERLNPLKEFYDSSEGFDWKTILGERE